MRVRSLLFVPGNDARKLEKALGSGADVLIPDLEDSIPESQKDRARKEVAAWAESAHGAYAGKIFPRVNDLASGRMASDMSALAAHVDGFVVPKVDSQTMPEVLGAIERSEASRRESGRLQMILLIESAVAVWYAYEIAKWPRVAALAFGSEDFAADMGCNSVMTYQARSLVVLAARAAQVQAIDTVYLRLDDPKGLSAHLAAGKVLGYDGTLCVHPAQVPPANENYQPTFWEIEYAQRVVAASAEANLRGASVAILEGTMIGTPMLRAARRLLEKAEASCVS